MGTLPFDRSASWRALFLIGLVTATLALGCKSAPVNPFAESADDDAGASERPEPASPLAGNPPANNALSVAAFESDAWVERVPPPFAKREDNFRRWHHHELNSLLELPVGSRPGLPDPSASTNPVVAANVAIVMAYWNAGQPGPTLAATIRNIPLRWQLRAAATEALGLIREPGADLLVRQLLHEFSPPSPPGETPRFGPQYNSDIHADLIRSLTRHAQPGDEVWFSEALRNPSWAVRYEGVLAWQQSRGNLPLLAVDRRTDDDPRVRAAALRMIATHRDPHAFEYLRQGLNDRSIEVHATAISALGELSTDEAHGLLRKLREDRSELSRAAAVIALAAAGVHDEVIASARDHSQHVRLAVAETLADAADAGRHVATQAVATAETMTHDASIHVQQAAVNSVDAWPLEQAGPVLLLAVAEGGYTARKAAASQLARRWPPAADFPVEAMAERRRVALAELRNAWIEQFGPINDAVVAAKAQTQDLLSLTVDQARDVRRLLDAFERGRTSEPGRRAAVAALIAYGPPVMLVLEQDALTHDRLPTEMYQDVLPAISGAFAALQRFDSPDLTQRRAAAVELASQATQRGLPRLASRRLAELLETERDPVVWRSALMALADDSSESALRVVYMGISDSSVEVRRRACDYLAAHGSPRHVPILLPALNDSDATVVLAAVRALGSVESLDDPQPLVRLLSSSDKQLRLEASLSLARLQYQPGIAGLERLALDTDLETRLRSAHAMGEVGDKVFVAALLAMLSDKPDVGRTAMASLVKIVGSDPAADLSGEVLPYDQKVKRWQQWHRDQQF